MEQIKQGAKRTFVALIPEREGRESFTFSTLIHGDVFTSFFQIY